MKKAILGVLSVSILLAACCAPTEHPTQPPSIVCVCECEVSCPQGTPESPEPTAARKVWTYEDMTVGLIQTGSEEDWRAANTTSYVETAADLGITLKLYDPQQGTKQFPDYLLFEALFENQLSAFRECIVDDKVDVIILEAIKPTGYDEVLEEARDAGKIVIVQAQRIDAPEDLYFTLIGYDFVEQGRNAGRAMAKLLDSSERKNVVELMGIVDSPITVDRVVGFREAIQGSGIMITKSQTANWRASEGKAVMETWLRETTDIQGVFAQNDEMAFGAIEAIEEAGLDPGIDVMIVSIGATDDAFTAILAGDLNVAVEFSRWPAGLVYEAAMKALGGDELPKWIPIQEGVFHTGNVAEPGSPPGY